jgi:hypothetical protein
VRNGLASEELPGFIADTARALEAPQLDKILADLTALRAELQEEHAAE